MKVRAVFNAAEDRIRLLDQKRADAAQDKRPDPTRRRRPRRDFAMLAVTRKGANVTRRLY